MHEELKKTTLTKYPLLEQIYIDNEDSLNLSIEELEKNKPAFEFLKLMCFLEEGESRENITQIQGDDAWYSFKSDLTFIGCLIFSKNRKRFFVNDFIKNTLFTNGKIDDDTFK